MTSQSTEFFSPNQIQEKLFSHERGLTQECEDSEKSDSSSNDSTQNFHGYGGVSIATNNSQSNAFIPTTNLFSGAHRQHVVQNNQPGVAMLGREEFIY